jgi:hypothetical protein
VRRRKTSADRISALSAAVSVRQRARRERPRDTMSASARAAVGASPIFVAMRATSVSVNQFTGRVTRMRAIISRPCSGSRGSGA